VADDELALAEQMLTGLDLCGTPRVSPPSPATTRTATTARKSVCR
jgi:hypothetical protein